MSSSNLETLPNEILIEIVEKYIDGIDLVRVFTTLQNQRIDAVIACCQRFHFNFFQCHKDDLRLCMGVLPAYMDKIEELTISEDHTPGQVHAFLSFYPSFQFFPRLRTLYFQFDEKATDLVMVDVAINSLLRTNIRTLSIKVIVEEKRSFFEKVFIKLFTIRSLRKLCLMSHMNSMNWIYLENISSNIEYLTVSGIHCAIEDLKYILQCASRLKHLDIKITGTRQNSYEEFNEILQMELAYLSQLYSLVLTFDQESSLTTDMLTPYLRLMPFLKRLTIKSHRELITANTWQLFIKTSLSFLTHFTLHTTTYAMEENEIERILSSFQNSYWLEKKNFNLIITKHEKSNLQNLDMDARDSHSRNEFNLPVIQCWMAPDRSSDNNTMVVKEKLTLKFDNLLDMTSCKYYFDNVTCIVIDSIDQTIIDWITTRVNYSRIKKIFITQPVRNGDILCLLMNHLLNAQTIYLSVAALVTNKISFVGQNNRIKVLHISLNNHFMNKQIPEAITAYFPYLEHLRINASYLNHIPILKECLPHLRSIAFEIRDRAFRIGSNNDRKLWEFQLRTNSNFLFHIAYSTMTVWIDGATWEELYRNRCLL